MVVLRVLLGEAQVHGGARAARTRFRATAAAYRVRRRENWLIVTPVAGDEPSW
jgi:hypothetical protein